MIKTPKHLTTALMYAGMINKGEEIKDDPEYTDFMQTTHNNGSLARLIQFREGIRKDLKEWEDDIIKMYKKTVNY